MLSFGDNGKENGHCYIVYCSYIGILEKNMSTTIQGIGFKVYLESGLWVYGF